MKIWNDEYEKDGMIYCKNCGGERLFIRNGFRARCACECQDRQYQEEERAKLKQERMKLQSASAYSILEQRFKEASFENTETGKNPLFDHAFARCKKYCESSDEVFAKGYGIYLHGDRGTGKSRLAACMTNELTKNGTPALFTNFGKIRQIILANKSEMVDTIKLASIDFLFIDDIGAQRVQTDNGDTWLQEKMFDIIDRRYAGKKPTVFTSNYTLKGLVSEVGVSPRTVDRIMGMSSAIIKIEGASYRREERKGELPF